MRFVAAACWLIILAVCAVLFAFLSPLVAIAAATFSTDEEY